MKWNLPEDCDVARLYKSQEVSETVLSDGKQYYPAVVQCTAIFMIGEPMSDKMAAYVQAGIKAGQLNDFLNDHEDVAWDWWADGAVVSFDESGNIGMWSEPTGGNDDDTD